METTRLTAGAEALGDRLDKWLATHLAQYSRARLQQWITGGFVLVNGAVATVRQPIWAGDDVLVTPQPSPDERAFAAEDVAFRIVHEDAAIIVVDKRAGLVVHPGSGNWSGTLLNGLLHHDPSLGGVPRAGIVHRLDKDTSGLMVVAKTLEAQTDLVRQLQARSVSRRYVALARGAVAQEGRVALPIGRDPRDRLKMATFDPKGTAPASKPAVTRFETLATASEVSFVLCTLESGRTHQIRVHLQAIGHPLVGDPVYGGRQRSPVFARQALHAWCLGLVHPTTRLPMNWTAALPVDLEQLARSLGFDPDALLQGIPADER